MSHPLEQSWARRCGQLGLAYESLRLLEDQSKFVRYLEYLDHNELELALDELEALAEASKPPKQTWSQLADAAETMDLPARADALRKLTPPRSSGR